MALLNIESGLELHIDERGRAELRLDGRRIPGQLNTRIDFPHREGGLVTTDFHMMGVKVVHTTKEGK